MAEQFKDQGGAASMTPSPLSRWFTSNLLTRLFKPERIAKLRQKQEALRQKQNLPHHVEYFHQVDDGYSHLAAQTLVALAARYDIKLECHLVIGPKGANVAEPDLLERLSRYDSHVVAPGYGLEFPDHPNSPDPQLVEKANRILAAQDNASFIQNAAAVGSALWAGDTAAMDKLAEQLGIASTQTAQQKLAAGTERRAELKHYSGAMFHYGNEWYWGVDRLHYLETRLAALGVDKTPNEPLIMPRKKIDFGNVKDDGSLTLEVFPSLRSPYTAIIFDVALKLAADSGVNLVVRPVLPMVMRGVPATREKGMYIFMDAAREAKENGVRYGKFYDPIGDPVRNAYSIYPWAVEQGKGNELLSSFLSCAFADGVNTNNDKGLKTVVERAGLDWQEAQKHIGDTQWKDLLENNRLDMYQAGIWGVPSFRLSNRTGKSLLAVWGQDRLWVVADEIKRQLNKSA